MQLNFSYCLKWRQNYGVKCSGDWDPKKVGPNSREGYPHVTEKVLRTKKSGIILLFLRLPHFLYLPHNHQVSCVRQHPQFNSRSLANNVAVLKLAGEPEEEVVKR